MSFELILPFLRPIAKYLAEEEVSEVLMNAGGEVFIERQGRLCATAERLSEGHRESAARNIARVLGGDIGPLCPLLNARLPDGSRVAAAVPPASVGGTILAIRKFRSHVMGAEQLVERRMLTAAHLETLRNAIQARETILISGGTGTGKTTLLNALAAYLPAEERIVVIEDTAEIQITAQNLVRLEARQAQPGAPEITIRELLRHTLRLRPDRILLGEVRGAEAFDLLQALNTGHTGTLSTIHANSARLAVQRLRTCIAMSGIDLPPRAIASNVAEAVQLIVHVERRPDGLRRVTEILQIESYDGDRDRFAFSDRGNTNGFNVCEIHSR